WVDERSLRRKCAVEEISVRQTMGFGDIPHDLAIGPKRGCAPREKLEAMLSFRYRVDEGLEAAALGVVEPELDDSTEPLDGAHLALPSHPLVQQTAAYLNKVGNAHRTVMPPLIGSPVSSGRTGRAVPAPSPLTGCFRCVFRQRLC